VDGELEATLGRRSEVARWIRVLRPDVVLGHDPWKRYRLHPDHRAEAERLGVAVRVVDAPRLAWDVDLPADLDVPDPSELAATRTSWT
jgi:LmbE family N-acetylglucosaminyl deacetylase